MPDYSTICGFRGYRVFHQISHIQNGSSDEPGQVTYTGTWNYELVTTPGSESAGWVATTEGDLVSSWDPSAHSQTASSAVLGDPSNPGDFNPYVWKNVQYYSPISLSYISGKLSEWKSGTETFRLETGSTNLDAPHAIGRAESNDYRGWASAGHFKWNALTDFTGNDDMWNGAFYVNFHVTTRQLYPTLYQTGFDDGTYGSWNRGKIAEGTAIYNNGYSEEVLSNAIPDASKYRDNYGVFGDGSELLDDAPKLSNQYFNLAAFDNFISDDNGAGHEITFVSRFGRLIRITINVMTDNGDWEADPTVHSSSQITTSATTLRVSHTLPALPESSDDESYWHELGALERWDATTEEWVFIADQLGELPLPTDMVSNTIEDTSAVLLYFAKSRYGGVWGFLEWAEPYEARYRTKTFTKALTCEADSATGGCGGAVTGHFDLEFVEEYSETTGRLGARTVNTFEMVVNGVDWTIEDHELLDGHIAGLPPSVETATSLKYEKPSITWPANGHEVKMDSDFLQGFYGSPHAGKLISESWVKAAVTESVEGANTYNLIDWTGIPNPASGQATVITGYRLTES